MNKEYRSLPIECVLDLLRASAPLEDDGASIRPSVEAIILTGALDRREPTDLCRLLVATAEANLPVARIVEGHVNALHLLHRHGSSAPHLAVLGVWGADGDAPLRAEGDTLVGGKRFASGLGTVTHALVTVGGEEGTRLALVEVGETERHWPQAWRMQGMRATLSGEVDLTGLTARWIGPPDAYFLEPSFVGGVWRIAALQLGGTFGLLAAARDRLVELGRLDADAQISRLSPLVARSLAAFGLVERAAAVASGPDGMADPDLAVALSIQSRLLTEDLAQDAIAAVERSIGLSHFDVASETGRIARDLATYCRQAARDAFEQRAGRILLGRGGALSRLWHG